MSISFLYFNECRSIPVSCSIFYITIFLQDKTFFWGKCVTAEQSKDLRLILIPFHFSSKYNFSVS